MNLDSLSEEVQNAVRAQIAAGVLQAINSEHRDAILAKSIQDALSGYSFKTAVEKAIAEEACRQVQEMMKEAQWQDIIKAKVVSCFQEFVEAMEKAIPLMLMEAFSGTNTANNYCDKGPGLLLKFLKRVSKDK